MLYWAFLSVSSRSDAPLELCRFGRSDRHLELVLPFADFGRPLSFQT